MQTVHADTNYFPLAIGSPLTQDWSDVNLITANDNWSGVPSIMGYLSGDVVPLADRDPQTILTDYSGTPDVNANQTLPNTFGLFGVTEFQIANPVVALAGSGGEDFPNLDIRLNTSACVTPITVSYNVRDIESSSDNSVQQVALQYRVGPTGNYTNIPAGYIADATTGPGLATLVTPVSVTLPADAQGQPQVHVRILDSNAAGNDEWIGIDDINVTCQAATAAGVTLSGRVLTADGKGIHKAHVSVYGANFLEPKSVSTKPSGYYKFNNLQAGQSYVVMVDDKRYTFQAPTRLVNLFGDREDIDFIADPLK